jgi:putative nucleotidyltransferase with HDIG domain
MKTRVITDAPPTMTMPSRILVVEDDMAVRDFCMRSLRLNGHFVTPAENGRVALDRLHDAAHPYDLVLTDLQMPEMSGIGLLREIRNSCTDTEVVVFTAYGTFETAREALRLGAFDYLTKPVSLDDLERTVRRAIEWRRVRQEKQRLSEIIALYEISQTFTSTLDTTTAVHQIVGLLWKRFAPQSLSLALYHPDDQKLELLAHHGLRSRPRAGARISADAHSDRMLEKALLQLIEDEPSPRSSHLVSLPLRTNDHLVGFLRMTRGIDQPGFGQDDRTMLAICASQIAASLDNSRLYQQLKNQNLQTISALAAAIDARDPYTHGHSEQVMRYAVRLAELLGLDAQQIENVRYGALLHDIGKIGIRDHILLKSSPLTDDELEVMQMHPKIGADIVRNIQSLQHIIPAIEGHHERIDGGGYPANICGTQLSQEARILAIADAYDAMTSHRAYRKGMEPEQALAILRDGRDTHWDGAFVDVFVEMIEREREALIMSHTRPAQLSMERLIGQPALLDARE